MIVGWGEDDYNCREYYGSWVNSMDDNSGSAWNYVGNSNYYQKLNY